MRAEYDHKSLDSYTLTLSSLSLSSCATVNLWFLETGNNFTVSSPFDFTSFSFSSSERDDVIVIEMM